MTLIQLQNTAFLISVLDIFFSELIDDEDDEETLTDLVAGPVGEGLAVKFMAHRKVARNVPIHRYFAGKVKELKATEPCYVF